MSTSKDSLIEINGLSIKKDAIYKVTHKPDPNAPSGFVKEGVTKLPSAGIGNTICCKFIGNGSGSTNPLDGLYDTGFYPQSPCYANMNKDDVASIVENLNKNIVEPYERIKGEGTLSHLNTEFWDSFMVDLYEGKFFVTEKVEDLLGLYIAMRGNDLTPKEKIGDPRFKFSQYCIEDKEKVQTVKTERANLMVDSIGNFTTLLKTNRELLLNILRYLGIVGVSSDIEDSVLNALVFEWLNKSNKNPEAFSKVFKMSKDRKTKEIVNLFVLVSKLVSKNIISRENGFYTYNGEELGADMKTVAANLNNDKKLSEIKTALIELS